MAEAAQSAGELPVKRPRVDEEEVNGGASAEMEVNNGAVEELPESMSSVIPGWFSEMSPMWPGDFHFDFDFVIHTFGRRTVMREFICICDYFCVYILRFHLNLLWWFMVWSVHKHFSFVLWITLLEVEFTL